MQEMQTRLEAARYVGEAGGGQIRVTADGKGDLLEVRSTRPRSRSTTSSCWKTCCVPPCAT